MRTLTLSFKRKLLASLVLAVLAVPGQAQTASPAPNTTGPSAGGVDNAPAVRRRLETNRC